MRGTARRAQKSLLPIWDQTRVWARGIKKKTSEKVSRKRAARSHGSSELVGLSIASRSALKPVCPARVPVCKLALMGCIASSPEKVAPTAKATGTVAVPKPVNAKAKHKDPVTSSQYFAPAAARFEGDIDAGFARAYECAEPAGPMDMQYPMHCMKMADFLELKTLDAHNGLVERGLVVPMDFDGAHKGVQVQFVSHQWLGYTVADPNGEHLATMQAAFRLAIEKGAGLFKSDEDWASYATGITADNLKTLAAAGADLVEGEATTNYHETHDLGDAAKEAFRARVREGWVWMDYISIPQTVGLSDTAAVQETIGKQSQAIRSIPAYVRCAQSFWICTPSGARHESGQVCSYATWNQRGWCRLEETTIALLNLRAHARPLLLTEPVGSVPYAVTPDSVDRVSVHVQRRNSVLTPTPNPTP